MKLVITSILFGWAIMASWPISAQLRLAVNVNRFKITDTKSYVYLGLVYHLPQNLIGPVLNNLVITTVNAQKAIINDSFSIDPPLGTSNTTFSTLIKYPLDTGSYNITITSLVLNGSDTVVATVPITVGVASPLQISDLFFFEAKYAKAINGLEAIGQHYLSPYPANFFPEGQNKLRFYFETYFSQSDIDIKKPYALTVRVQDINSYAILKNPSYIKRVVATNREGFLFEFDISTLPSGSYQLVVELLDSANKPVVRKLQKFHRSNPGFSNEQNALLPMEGNFLANESDSVIKRYLRALYPIATSIENKTISSIVESGTALQCRQYLLGFWERRNKVKPQEPFAEFVTRYQHAEKAFTRSGLEPYETDRGRVLIQYGFPNRIENEYSDQQRSSINNGQSTPYEIWYYYNTDWQNQSGLEFVFTQNNLGDNNYVLVHSNAVGEIYNPQWRRAVEEHKTNPLRPFDDDASPYRKE